MTEILEKKDPRIASDGMQEAKGKVFNGLMNRGTFNKMKRSELPYDAVPMPGKIIYTLKSQKHGSEKAKVRCLVC